MERLESILDYIAEDNPDAAIAMIDRISEQVAFLGDLPEMGSHYLRSKVSGLRQLIVRPYRIVYLLDEENQIVHVVAVQHMREGTVPPENLLEGGE